MEYAELAHAWGQLSVEERETLRDQVSLLTKGLEQSCEPSPDVSRPDF